MVNLKNVSFLVMDDFYRNRSARLSDEIKRVVNETRVSFLFCFVFCFCFFILFLFCCYFYFYFTISLTTLLADFDFVILRFYFLFKNLCLFSFFLLAPMGIRKRILKMLFIQFQFYLKKEEFFSNIAFHFIRILNIFHSKSVYSYRT